MMNPETSWGLSSLEFRISNTIIAEARLMSRLHKEGGKGQE